MVISGVIVNGGIHKHYRTSSPSEFEVIFS
jgi:hypothetical protein